VRRNVGRHADGDAGAVDQKVGEFRRQHRRFAVAAVVIGLKIDGVLVDVVESASARSWSGGIRCTAWRCRIAVHRAKSLPVDQRHAHGEILR
jgi:hypothetical protein